MIQPKQNLPKRVESIDDYGAVLPVVGNFCQLFRHGDWAWARADEIPEGVRGAELHLDEEADPVAVGGWGFVVFLIVDFFLLFFL
tara:strand:+ start:213 stop:467 length:255 start_codon:yes stop_codon:yes gene_type:complete